MAPPANTNSLSGANFWDVFEQPGTSAVHLPPTGERRGIFTADLPMAAVVGLTQAQFSDNIEDYSALITASPARTPWLRIAACCYANGGTSQTCQVFIRLKFHATFWDRVTLTGS